MILGRRPPRAVNLAPEEHLKDADLDDPELGDADLGDADLDVTELDDAELVLRARSDAEAFGLLYDRYCDSIYRYVFRRLNQREAAEDVTAEVFFKAIRGLDSYRPELAPFSAWLYRIAANAVVDHVRARRPTSALDGVPESPDPAAAVEDQVIDRTEADRVWSAVDLLNPAQRTAVTLRLGHDLPIAEVAARMNRSEGAVKLLLNRGLRTVRGHLGTGPGGREGPSGAAPGDEEARR